MRRWPRNGSSNPTNHWLCATHLRGTHSSCRRLWRGVDRTEDVAAEAPALLLFVNRLAEAKGLAVEAARHMDPDTLLWIAYPKASGKRRPDVNRDKLWKAMEPSGWRPVRQVALDADWSAMWVRPADRVRH